MSREILFRGFSPDNYYEKVGKDTIIINGKTIQGFWEYGYYSEDTGTPTILNNDGDYIVIPETVGQYTGINDKNGKKIFEGDIIKYKYSEWDEEESEINYVEYGSEWGYPSFDLHDNNLEDNALSEIVESGNYDFSVVGNIFSNPELLESEGNNET